jgi:hypothetical protein
MEIKYIIAITDSKNSMHIFGNIMYSKYNTALNMVKVYEEMGIGRTANYINQIEIYAITLLPDEIIIKTNPNQFKLLLLSNENSRHYPVSIDGGISFGFIPFEMFEQTISIKKSLKRQYAHINYELYICKLIKNTN